MKRPNFFDNAARILGYWTPTICVWLLTRALMRVRVAGCRHIPKHGAFLLLSNHISHFEPPMLATAIPRKMSWVVGKDMYAHTVGDAFFRCIDAIPMDREKSDRVAVREILRRLHKGMPVGLFPEGGIRSGSGSLLGGQPIDEAVGTLARLGRAPVVPCVVLGTDKLYCKDAWAWKTAVDFRFGAPLLPEKDELPSAFMLRVAVAIRTLAEETRDAHGLTENDFPKTAQERWRERS